MVFEGLRDYDGCPVAVLDVCGMGDQPQQVSVCVGYDMTLTPLCFLARIIATRAAALGRLDRLAVDDPSGGRGLPSRQHTRRRDKRIVQNVQYTAVAHLVEIVLHGRERRKLFGQHGPLAARGRDVLDRIPYRAHASPARAARFSPLGHKMLDQSPFRVGNIACITKAAPVIVRAGDFSPRHDFLQVDNSEES